MKTLEKHNKEKLEKFCEELTEPKFNRLKCKCGSELIDTNPNIILDSWPPKKAVHCEGCGFTGYRYV